MLRAENARLFVHARVLCVCVCMDAAVAAILLVALWADWCMIDNLNLRPCVPLDRAAVPVGGEDYKRDPHEVGRNPRTQLLPGFLGGVHMHCTHAGRTAPLVAVFNHSTHGEGRLVGCGCNMTVCCLCTF
mgnify:CR=1 FL=1